MTVRLADDAHICVTAGDGLIERPGGPPLLLPGEGPRLRTLVALLLRPRCQDWLRSTLAQAHPKSAGGDLVGRLLEEGVLLPWGLGARLAEVHGLTRTVGNWPGVGPGAEPGRMIREQAGEGPVRLPPPTPPDVRLADALAWRRSVRHFSGRPLPLAHLATLLALAAGLGEGRAGPPGPLSPGGPPAGRTYPSGGALYPVEILVYPLRVDGIDPRFYYYQVLGHRLVPAAPPRPVAELVHRLHDHPIADAGFLLLLYVDFARLSLSKYGERAYYLSLLEAGHIGQNVLLTAVALGLGGLPLGGFDDQELSLAAGLDYPQEAIVYVLVVGAPAAGGTE